MFQIFVYIPESHLEVVKKAMFIAGGGRLGDYDCCAWQTKGEGQFRPPENSKPFLGREGDLEKVSEYRVEMICKRPDLSAVIDALKTSHPYEEPAFGVVELHSV